MAISQQDYYLQPGETITAYNTRIAGLRGDTSEQLASMQQAAQKQAVISGPTSEYTKRLGTSITPQSLTPTTPFPLVSANTTPTYNVGNLQVPEMQATPQEEKASSLSGQLGDLYNSMVGKSQYQSLQNEKFGVNAAQATIQDLSAQLTGLKNEAAAIPLQLQQGAAERGVTLPQLGRQENSRLRTNAIAALGVSTLLAASQGQLANAQSLANQAVAQKYDPILERIEATRANLELILNDPLTSLQDKNRALQQQAIQDAKEQQTLLDKQNATSIWEIATTAASNGGSFQATPQYPSLSLALQAISQAPTREAALQIAVSTGLLQDAEGSTSRVLGSASTGYFSYDEATGQTTPISAAGYSPSGSGGSASGGTSSGFKFTATQTNSGASVAGMSLTEFKSLPGDVQNFYINNKTLANQFEEALAGVASGDASAEQVIQNVQSMNLPSSVKQYLINQVKAVSGGSTTTSTSGSTAGLNFMDTSGTSSTGGAWSTIKGFFSNLF